MDHTHFSLSRPLSSSSCLSCRDLRFCPCSRRRPLGPMVALGQDLMLKASLRMDSIPSGVSSQVWARGRTRLFDVCSYRGNSSLSLSSPSSLLLSLYPVGWRTLSVTLAFISQVATATLPPLACSLDYSPFACKREITGNQKQTDKEKRKATTA